MVVASIYNPFHPISYMILVCLLIFILKETTKQAKKSGARYGAYPASSSPKRTAAPVRLVGGAPSSCRSGRSRTSAPGARPESRLDAAQAQPRAQMAVQPSCRREKERFVAAAGRRP